MNKVGIDDLSDGYMPAAPLAYTRREGTSHCRYTTSVVAATPIKQPRTLEQQSGQK